MNLEKELFFIGFKKPVWINLWLKFTLFYSMSGQLPSPYFSFVGSSFASFSSRLPDVSFMLAFVILFVDEEWQRDSHFTCTFCLLVSWRLFLRYYPFRKRRVVLPLSSDISHWLKPTNQSHCQRPSITLLSSTVSFH